MEILSMLSDICSILAFLATIFIANEAVKISKKININNNLNSTSDSSNTNKQSAFGTRNEQNIQR